MADNPHHFAISLFKLFIFQLLAYLLVFSAQAQTVSLEKNEVFEGDLFNLIIELENQTPSLYHLDTSPLDQNFEVINVESSLKSKFKESTRINLMRWVITLYPKKTGVLEIPELQIKNTKTTGTFIQVNSLPEAEFDMFQFDIEAEPSTALVGTQTIVTVRLKHSLNIDNRHLKHLVAANKDELDQYRLGDESYSIETNNNKTFDVIEHRFAIFPKNTGTLNFLPVDFFADIVGEKDTAFIRRLKRSSKPLSINVAPLDKAIVGTLVAGDVTIDQQWHNSLNKLEVGESLSTTVIMTVKGLPASHLPEDILLGDAPETSQNYTIYADNPIRQTESSNRGLTSTLQQDYVIVFEKEGIVTIPKTEVSWWDTNDFLHRQIILPERSFEVLKTAAPVTLITSSTNSSTWLIILTALFILLLIALKPGWIGFYSPGREADKKFKHRLLKKACLQNDAKKARLQIGLWLDSGDCYGTRDSFRNSNVAETSEIHYQIRLLDNSLYSKIQPDWNGKNFWNVFRRHRKQTLSSSKIENRLNDLYPL